MNAAFSNWTAAKTNNESNLGFTQISSIPNNGQDVYFTLRISRLYDMPDDAWGVVTTWALRDMDYNGDGQRDDTRLMYADIEINASLSTQDHTAVMAHEIGHTMGLDECGGCDVTTVMSYHYQAVSPSSCDTNQVKTYFP